MNRLADLPRLLCGLCVALISPAYGGATDARAAEAGAQSAPPGYSTGLRGGSHDFEFLVGAWTTRQKRLKVSGEGSSDWQETPSNRHCALSFLDGVEIVDQSRFPDGSAAGLFLFGYNRVKQQWSLYWISPKTGQPDAGTVGGFTGKRGDFFGPDVDGKGRPIKVRVRWTVFDHDHVRWEQAFSYDNRTWKTNWVSDYTRGDPKALCHNS
ncbi:MAG TPA: hypothetical protein VFA39_18860 [Steroidobacteraceae bacterium]|nr:hypothetical protein [Steroidobacteraceae bacterium]